jgi:hypothetical protein
MLTFTKLMLTFSKLYKAIRIKLLNNNYSSWNLSRIYYCNLSAALKVVKRYIYVL